VANMPARSTSPGLGTVPWTVAVCWVGSTTAPTTVISWGQFAVLPAGAPEVLSHQSPYSAAGAGHAGGA
jgi:hypothetical protein